MVLIKNGITEVFYSYFNIRILLVADILLAIIALLIAYICFDVTIIHLVCFIFTIIILIELRYIVPKFRSSFLYTILILFVSLFMVAWYIIKESNINKTKQFEFIALKVAMEERIGYDKLTEENLGVVENQIKMDSTLREYIIYSKNVDKNYVSDYLKDNYFGNIWQLYELNIDILPYDQIKKKYMREKWDFIEFSGVTTPHFYKKRSPGSCSYKGIYKDANQNGDTIALYINLMRRQDSKYMEHPETGLISYSKNPWHRVSSALYYDNQLILSNGKFPYSKRFNFYKTWPNRFYQEYFDGHKHYTLMMDPHRRVIISEEAHPTWRLYIIFMTYMFCIFVAIAFLINLWINGDLFKNYYMKGSIFNKLKNFFILFLFVCIFVIMCISVHQLIQNKYEEKKADIMSSVNFVKSTIEKEIHNCNTNDYKDTYRRVMDELYEKYDLPIHLYDKSGGQILSTYPYLRINRITSRLMNPDYFFRGNYETVILTEKIGNLEHLCGYATLYDKDNNNIGYICIPYYMSLSNLHEEIYRYILLFLNIYLAIIMLSIILFYIFTRNISGPVNEIRTKLDNLELGGKNEHINYPENRNDEIGALIKQYNNLIDDLDEKVNELAENERDNLWREIAKQIAHEIKNPLTPMKLAIQQMRRLKNTDRSDNYFDTATEMLMGQIDSLTNIASDFSSFARMAPTKLVPVNIIDRLISVLHLHMNNAEGIILEYDSTILHAMIMGDSEQLIQIFNNIIKNGMQAIPSDKEGNIKVKVEADIEYITITITDNGNGIPDSIKENIFKPNFTTKSSGNGIGLALVKTYVNAMGGEINFESQENIGTTFTLIFPLIKI